MSQKVNDFKDKLEQENRAKRSSKNTMSIKISDKQKPSIGDSPSSNNLTPNKNLNPFVIDINTNSNPSNTSGDNRNSTEKNSSKSSKEKKEKYPITYYKNFAYSIAVKFNGKIEKSESELNLENKLSHYTKYLSMVPNAEKIKSEINFKSNNYNNITNNNNNVTRTYSVKSEEKNNTKINFEQFINYDDIPNYKSDSPNIILSDKINIENDDHKLDYLIKILETYKDIIIEQNYCKNYQDRIVLNIYIDLSQISFKLYNTPEKLKSKINYLRKYMCNLTDDIKFNILKYPNKTLTSINQKFIDISQITSSYNEELNSSESSSVKEENSDKESSNENLFNDKEEKKEEESKKINTNKNEMTEKIKENNEKNQISSINFSSMKLLENSKSSFTENSENEKNEYKNYDDEDSELLYENLEEFNDNDDDQIGINNSIDGKIFNNSDYDNSNDENNDYNYYNPINNNINPSEFANSMCFKRCARRNATTNISTSGKIHCNIGSSKMNLSKININNNNTLQEKEIRFEIIDFNDIDNLNHIENKNQTIFESPEVFKAIEIHSKNIQNLIFSEDNKKQRKYNSFHTDEFLITADGNNQKKLKEMGDIISNNIISIVKKSGNVIPNHDEKMTPIEINDYIIEKEKQLKEESNPRNKVDIKNYYDFEEKEESQEEDDENEGEEEEENEEDENSENNFGEESESNYVGEEEEKKIGDENEHRDSKSFEGHQIYDNLEKGRNIFEFDIDDGEEDN